MQETAYPRYGKPNMAALEGEWGRRIFEHIKNTPRPDYAKLDAESKAIEDRMLKAVEDGTF